MQKSSIFCLLVLPPQTPCNRSLRSLGFATQNKKADPSQEESAEIFERRSIAMKEVTVTLVLEVPNDLEEIDFCVQLERMVNDRADFEFVKVLNYSEKEKDGTT